MPATPPPMDPNDPALFNGSGMEFESIDDMPWDQDGMDDDSYRDPFSEDHPE